MSNQENALAEKVRTREDFVRFVQVLAANAESSPGDCPNDRTATYLEALAAWTADMDGYFRNRREPVPPQPDWCLMAKMLVAAKYYD